VHSAEPTEQNFAANHSTVSIPHANHLAQPNIANSVPSSTQASYYSTQITAEKSASVQSLPEISANHSTFRIPHANHLAQPNIANSVPSSTQASYYSTQITAEKSASVQSLPEISANQIYGNFQNSSNLLEQKLAAAINNLTTKISVLQNNFNRELDTIKNDLKNLQKNHGNFF
jgi:hypothetical protein